MKKKTTNSLLMASHLRLQELAQELYMAKKELAQKNEELKKLDQLKSDFVANVSHELRTPLTSMKNMASNILAGVTGEIGGKLKRYLFMMNEDIDRLSRLISNLLDISRIEAGKTVLKKRLVDIDALARRAISSLRPQADEKKIKLEIISPPDLEDLYVDADNISQVFTNLIGNAIKFTPEGGTIAVTIDDRDKEVLCGVSDTGKGIPKNELNKLFIKFYQVGRVDGLGAKGTGLGLAISRELIEMHHGKIWAESEVGKGSTFSFILPKTDREIVFREYLSNAMAQASQHGVPLSLLVVAVAGFNQIRKEHEVKGANKLLREIEGIIKNAIRLDDNIGEALLNRYHKGEITAILLEEGQKDTAVLTRKLKKAIETHHFALNGKLVNVGVNVGMASYPDDAGTEDELIKRAETSLEEWKKCMPQMMVMADTVSMPAGLS